MFAQNPRTGCSTALLAGSVVLSLSGCEEPKQKVLDIQTPGVKIEVERSTSGGALNIETGKNGSGANVDVDADARDGAKVKVEPKE